MELSSVEGGNTCGDFRCILQDGGGQLISEILPTSDIESLSITDSPTLHDKLHDNESIPEGHAEDSKEFWYTLNDSDQSFSTCFPDPARSSARTPRDFYRIDGRQGDSTPREIIEDHDVIYDAQQGFNRYSHYTPVENFPDLVISKEYSTLHHANWLGSQLNIPGWMHELEYENDFSLKAYLSFGVQNGFYIVDPDADISSYERENYSSVLHGEPHVFIDKLIKSELSSRKYVLTSNKPTCIHSIGAIPKKSGGWRPITDCKRPIGSSINSFMSTTFREFCYTTVDNVIEIVQPGCYMASVDISAAYRSILIHPSQWKYQGIKWEIDGVQQFLCDTHVCFGLRCAPYLFTQVSNFILRCLHRRGFKSSLVYLDDFLVLGDTKEECLKAQLTLISILRSLGFFIAWNKCVAPTQKIVYLGVEFNSIDMSVRLPNDKMKRLFEELEFFTDKSRATKRQVQRLCGILAHCAKVVRGGRTFSQRVIHLLKAWPMSQKRIRLSEEFRHDIMWWKEFAQTFNGKNLMIKFNHGQGPSFFTDSCLSGYGLWHEKDWQAGYFNVTITPNTSILDHEHHHWMNIHLDDHDSSSTNINVLELIPVWLCLRRNAASWRDLHVLCRSDNLNVIYMINKGCSSNDVCMAMIRDIFWICASENIFLSAHHIPGADNIIADVLSRMCFTNDLSVINEYGLCCSASASSGYG